MTEGLKQGGIQGGGRAMEEGIDIKIRDGFLLDGEAVRRIAFSIMKSYGMDPDPDGLDIELGHFGENYIGAVAQLVACKGSKIVGSIILKYQSPNDGKITGFYIDSKYRGLRAGHLLLSEAINRAKIARLDGIYLDTWDKMETAIWIYKKFGWKQIEDPPKSSGAQRRYYLRLK
jgi:ribosomal protein S18 acetylase RimI-like enzyme